MIDPVTIRILAGHVLDRLAGHVGDLPRLCSFKLQETGRRAAVAGRPKSRENFNVVEGSYSAPSVTGASF
jgi:hypothetical protein